jgi:hypothetical protein
MSENILPHMILLKNIMPWWMDLLENILMACEKYILEYPFLFMLTRQQNNIPILLAPFVSTKAIPIFLQVHYG